VQEVAPPRNETRRRFAPVSGLLREIAVPQRASRTVNPKLRHEQRVRERGALADEDRSSSLGSQSSFALPAR
jgi:hypothetical protein